MGADKRVHTQGRTRDAVPEANLASIYNEFRSYFRKIPTNLNNFNGMYIGILKVCDS